VSSVRRTEFIDLFKNIAGTSATDARLIFLIEDLNSQSWLWTECDLLSSAIQQLSVAKNCDHKILCFLKPFMDSPRHLSEVRNIFENGSKSTVHSMKPSGAILRWHENALPFKHSRLLKALAVVQWVLNCRSVLHAGSVNALGHFVSDPWFQYKGPINSLCTSFDSLEQNNLSSSYFGQLLCEDLLSNGIHECDVLSYRKLFLDFVHHKSNFCDKCSYECSLTAMSSSTSLIYFLSEFICADLEENVLRPAFFGLCSRQVDVPFFNETSAQIPKNIKEKRGKCLELKTKLQHAVNDAEHMTPDAMSEAKWESICSKIPSHLFPELIPFLKMEGLILITSLNIIIDRILESTTNILKYVNNETELSFAVSADAGHLNLGIVPLSWDQSASNIFVRYTEYLSLLQFQKKIFDFVCMQIEKVSEMAEEEDQRLTILSAGVAVRSFSSYIVPKFANHLATSNQDMLSLLGKPFQLSTIRQWMIGDSENTKLLFWTPFHRFGNQLRREVLSPSALHFQSIKEFVRDCVTSDGDWKCTNEGANDCASSCQVSADLYLFRSKCNHCILQYDDHQANVPIFCLRQSNMQM
jgi:hypothetical protein